MRILLILLVFSSSLFSQITLASLVVGGTRVIFNENEREAKISVSNRAKNTPYLVQSWIDNFSENDTKKVPFTVTPPLFRLDAGNENILRIIKTGEDLPQDRESIFYLNIKSISPSQKSEINKLEISVRTQIKLIWRPKNLSTEEAQSAYKELKMKYSKGSLLIENPTPYYVSFASVKIDGHEIKQADMVGPYSNRTFKARTGKKITWQSINDFGGISTLTSSNL